MAYGQKQAEAAEKSSNGKWFQPGVNPAQIKAWSIETNSSGGKSLKIIYQYPDPTKPQSEWQTINEFISFPYAADGTLSEKAITRFEGLLRTFFLNFVSKEQYFDRLDAVGTKYGFDEISQDLETSRTQFEHVINASFDLVKGKLGVEGILICGYNAPKEVNGEVKQYLAPMNYGQGNIWKCAFRTDKNDTEMPAEATEFSNETDKKYKYWSYKREDEAVKSTNTDVDAAPEQEKKEETQPEW